MTKKLLIILLLAVSCLPLAARADKLTSGSNTLYDTINGGGATLQNSSYQLIDSKGESMGGKLTGGTNTLILGILGLLEQGIPSPEGTIEVVDTGWIRETTITRIGEDLRLDWGYDPLKGPTNVKIHALSGPGIEFSSTGTFTEVAAVPSGMTTYTHATKAHDGNNWYYRVVPAAETNIMSEDANSITVGKAETALTANKYLFASLPFQEDNISLAGILGDQLGAGGEFLWWTGAAYKGATYSTGTWTGNDRALRIGEGFILRAKADKAVALVGRFGKTNSPFVRNLTAGQYDLVAYPYPTTRLFEAMGITPDSGADLLRWKVDTQAYEGATYSGGSWTGTAGINNLELARPRYYRPKGNFTWTIQFP